MVSANVAFVETRPEEKLFQGNLLSLREARE